MALRLVPTAPTPPTAVVPARELDPDSAGTPRLPRGSSTVDKAQSGLLSELDVDILKRAGRGDRDACRAFVGCYERRVFTLCARLLGDHGAAEDAAQETFFKALKALVRFDATQAARPSTWLLTIATHHCLDELRKRRRRPALVGVDAVDVLAVAVEGADVGVAARSAEQQVERALRGLSDDHRAVFVLRILAERSVEETAVVLGIDAGTVKSRLSRARDAARRSAMTSLPDDDDGFDAFVKDALPELAAPAGLVDDVVARRQRPARRFTTIAAFGAGALAASIAFAAITPRSPPPSTSGLVVSEDARFTVTVDQDPAMPLPAAAKTPLTFALGGLVGTAIATIAVHDGEVRVDNGHGAVVVAAGEHATIDAAHPPTKTDGDAVVAAEKRLQNVVAAIAATEAAAAGDTTALVTENTRLRALVKKQDEELALLDVDRVERDGEPIPFPKDVPDRLTEKALLTAFTAALKDSGVDGDVRAIDCAEFPCIVWGEMNGDTATLSETLKTSKAFAAYADDGKHVRGWGAGDGKTQLFAMTLTPDDPNRSEDDTTALHRRIRFRAEGGYEANKPASWADVKE